MRTENCNLPTERKAVGSDALAGGNPICLDDDDDDGDISEGIFFFKLNKFLFPSFLPFCTNVHFCRCFDSQYQLQGGRTVSWELGVSFYCSFVRITTRQREEIKMDLSTRKSNANERCNRDSTGRQQKQQLNYTSSNRRYVLLSLLSINRHQQSDSAAAPVVTAIRNVIRRCEWAVRRTTASPHRTPPRRTAENKMKIFDTRHDTIKVRNGTQRDKTRHEATPRRYER